MSILINGTELGNQISLGNTDLSEIIFNDTSVWKSRIVIKKYPISTNRATVVVHNNEIHVLGGEDANNSFRNHYKWNGTNWVFVSTIPYDFYGGAAVVYNNEIHIFGARNISDRKKHYKWNGSSWVSVSTLPYEFIFGGAVVYNNEIHILGSETYSSNHYKLNGSSWSSVSRLPYQFFNGQAVVTNNRIYILGTDNTSQGNKYSSFTGTWTSLSTLPYQFNYGSAVVYNNEIHILGGVNSGSGYRAHYKLNGANWVSDKAIPEPYRLMYASPSSTVVWNDEMVLLPMYNSTRKRYDGVIQYDGTSWIGED